MRAERRANMVLYLCSDKAGFIIGENICIDGGMTHQMIYHGDNGWKLESEYNVSDMECLIEAETCTCFCRKKICNYINILLCNL